MSFFEDRLQPPVNWKHVTAIAADSTSTAATPCISSSCHFELRGVGAKKLKRPVGTQTAEDRSTLAAVSSTSQLPDPMRAMEQRFMT